MAFYYNHVIGKILLFLKQKKIRFFSLCLIKIIAFIYPNYIAPLFDRYDPLREGDLRSSIETLAAKINFPLAKIYVVEGES